MYFNEHAPPHFHASYGEYEIVIEIGTGRPLRGRFPRNQLRYVEKWAKVNKEALLDNWQRAMLKEDLKRIAPDYE